MQSLPNSNKIILHITPKIGLQKIFPPKFYIFDLLLHYLLLADIDHLLTEIEALAVLEIFMELEENLTSSGCDV